MHKTDDVGVFLSPLSNEYLLAAKNFGLSSDDLLDMCDAATTVIFGDVDEKARIKQKVADYRIKGKSATDYLVDDTHRS